MSELDDDIATEQLLELARDAWMNEVHTCFPGRVDRYDPATQLADIVPLVRRSVLAQDGSRVVESLPTLRAVRVAWPSAGDWFMHFPLAEGDTGMVECAERDFTAWATTGQVGDPADIRNHSLSFAIFRPGLRPRTRALSGLPTDAMVIGKQGGATLAIKDDGDVVAAGGTHLVALENLVSQALTDLKTAISGAATGASDGGAAFKANLLAALSSWPPSVAAAHTRAA